MLIIMDSNPDTVTWNSSLKVRFTKINFMSAQTYGHINTNPKSDIYIKLTASKPKL